MDNYYKHGDWNAICDVCGFRFKASKLRKRWDGLYVCEQDWNPRHPQDLIRYPTEDTGVPWSRPEGADVELSVSYVASTVGVQNNVIFPPSFHIDGQEFITQEDPATPLLTELGEGILIE